MTADVDSIEELRARVTELERQNDSLAKEKAELEAALAARSADRASTCAALVEQFPMAIGVFHRDGVLVELNLQAERVFGITREVGIGRFNPLMDPQSIALGTPAIFAEVLKGNTVTRPPYRYDSREAVPGAQQGRVLWVDTVYFPLVQSDGAVSHIVTLNRDVTVQMEQEAALSAAKLAVEAAQRELAAQQETITALSSPVIQVWEGILTIPLIGVIDERRAARITEDLLNAIVHQRAQCVILDVTGVARMDSQIGSYLISATRACRLLGSEVALVGIGSDTAQTIVNLGMDLSGIVTRANLRAGIAWAFQRRGLTVMSVRPE
jgi:rsbT co-antagonist protein RsbR